MFPTRALESRKVAIEVSRHLLKSHWPNSKYCAWSARHHSKLLMEIHFQNVIGVGVGVVCSINSTSYAQNSCFEFSWDWSHPSRLLFTKNTPSYCPACRTYLIATRFWVVVICPIIKCLTVLEFSFILFDLCLFITIFNFILNYVPIVTFWIFTYHKIWILLIIFCFIWNYWIIYFLTCLEVFWSVVS